MSDTLFGKIIRREVPADIVYEDEDVLGFNDISPQAPLHVLFIPKKPLATIDDARSDDALLLGRLMLAAAGYARAQGVAADGYRLVVNCNAHGGQTVFHLHVHLLAGRRMHWPPG